MAGAASASAGGSVFLREDFESLDRWRPLHFRSIAEHSVYTIETSGGESFLRAESRASASGLILRESWDVGRFHRLSWRWKVDRVYEKGDVSRREGDDYPIRIYVLFRYDPSRLGILDRIKYGAARVLYGEYPPHATLNYIWANRKEETGVYVSTYTDRARLIPLESGPEKVGTWVEERVDIQADYRRAFGEEPPAEAALGIMNDSDNTGESSVSWLDDLVVSEGPEAEGEGDRGQAFPGP